MIVLYGKVNLTEDAAARGRFAYTLLSPDMQVRFSGRISNDPETDSGEISVDPQKGVIERCDTSKECLAHLKKFVALAEKAKTLVDVSDLKTFKPTDLDPDPEPELEPEPEPESEDTPESE